MTLGFTEIKNGKPTNFKEKILSGEKIHTIRENKKGRWRKGIILNFVTGSRTPQRNEFKTSSIISTQEITVNGSKVYIEGKLISDIAALAINDGFSNAESFFEWFNGDFEGVIIHWTNYKY